MITEAVANWFLRLVATVVSWVPPLPDEADAALDSVPGYLASVAGYVAKFDPLVPFAALNVAVGITLAFWITAAAIQAARIVASFATVGGGGV